MPSVGKTVGYGVKSARLTARGGGRATRWVSRQVKFARRRGGGGEAGMMRLLDLHAVSCAGDTLVTMGLAGTAFFRAQDPGAARGQVGLYLLLTMAPFALIAPVVGPVLDRFRHGRRVALAVTMFGRAFLAWVISDYIHGFGLYPAALGVLVLSRAYGVARSAAVPRLLPATLRLSEAGARASVFGAVAGLAVTPIGALAFTIGPQWALRVAALVFLFGTVIALGLPPRADSDPPETVPAIFKRTGRALYGRLVFATLTNTAILRALYGFLALFVLFAVRARHLSTQAFGIDVGQGGALAVIIGALGIGSFVATAVGTRLHIHRPALLQAGAMVAVTLLGVLSLVRFNLTALAVLCLGTAVASQLAKLAIDATIQERIAEPVRASAFAHSETVLMLAWVLGGGIGLVPFGAWWGVALVVAVLTLLTARGLQVAIALRNEKLSGVASGEVPPAPPVPEPTTHRLPSRTRRLRARTAGDDPEPTPTQPLRVEDATTEAIATRVMPRDDTEPEAPGYHLYRPSGTPPDDDEVNL